MKEQSEASQQPASDQACKVEEGMQGQPGEAAPQELLFIPNVGVLPGGVTVLWGKVEVGSVAVHPEQMKHQDDSS